MVRSSSFSTSSAHTLGQSWGQVVFSRTTASLIGAASSRSGLVVRQGVSKRGQLVQGRVDLHQPRKGAEGHVEAPRVVHLRRKADVGKGHRVAEKVGAGAG